MITNNLAKQKTFIYIYIYTLQKIDFILNFYRTLILRFLSTYQSSFYDHTHTHLSSFMEGQPHIYTHQICAIRSKVKDYQHANH